MRAKLTDQVLATDAGRAMESIIRSCVHCGFCNATCPTYQLTGDELDGPRGRIYLIKALLEGRSVSERTRTHLDRCLTCRACETTCPSGVRYGTLNELVRPLVERRVPRSVLDRLRRRVIRLVVPYPGRFRLLQRLALLVRPVLPRAIREMIPAAASRPRAVRSAHQRSVVMLGGCVQEAAAPEINSAACTVLNRFGFDCVTPAGTGCCGAVSYHLGAIEEAAEFARRNIDAWWPLLGKETTPVMATSSGCAQMLKTYPELFGRDDPYFEKAGRIVASLTDPAELIGRAPPARDAEGVRVAFHSPCTLQHGLGMRGGAEAILSGAGYALTTVADPHLCCGSAGTYSLLEPRLSLRLLDAKLEALQADAPDVIATANIGCLLHLRRRAAVPVVHWLELVAEDV